MNLDQMVYCVIIVMGNALVRPMSLVINVPSVLMELGIFLHVKVNKNITSNCVNRVICFTQIILWFVKTVAVMSMAWKTIRVITQVENALVKIILMGKYVMLVHLGGMVSQTVKVR